MIRMRCKSRICSHFMCMLTAFSTQSQMHGTQPAIDPDYSSQPLRGMYAGQSMRACNLVGKGSAQHSVAPTHVICATQRCGDSRDLRNTALHRLTLSAQHSVAATHRENVMIQMEEKKTTQMRKSSSAPTCSDKINVAQSSPASEGAGVVRVAQARSLQLAAALCRFHMNV